MTAKQTISSRPLLKNPPQDIYLKSRFMEPINNPSLSSEKLTKTNHKMEEK